MAERRPLVIGEEGPEELPAGDTIPPEAAAPVLQQNTTASYVDGYGFTNTISIARASDFDDGGIRYVAGGASFRQRVSPAEQYDTEVAGYGLSTYLFNPAQAGAAYTTRGVVVAGDQISFTAFSISKATKGFLGSSYITIEPESIDDPSDGGFSQKVIKVPNKSGTLALVDQIQRPAPLTVADGEAFHVLENNQVPFMLPIKLDGNAQLVISGALIGVC